MIHVHIRSLRHYVIRKDVPDRASSLLAVVQPELRARSFTWH